MRGKRIVRYKVGKKDNMEYSYNIVLYPDDFYIELI